MHTGMGPKMRSVLIMILTRQELQRCGHMLTRQVDGIQALGGREGRLDQLRRKGLGICSGQSPLHPNHSAL